MEVTGQEIATLETPALLLDPGRMARNIGRMHAKVAELGVGFRPHVKTAKSLEVVRRMTGGAPGPVTVSTLREAEELADAGYTDILYAVGLTPNKVARVEALRRRGVDLKVIVDNAAAAEAIAAAVSPGETPLPVWIEIDSDGHRAGVKPGDAAALRHVAATLSGGGLRPDGVMTHAGDSYSARSPDAIRGYAERERDAVVTAARVLREAGHGIAHVSVGSTPTGLFAQDLTGVTEMRTGVFVFQDLVMAGIGVCAVDDIAISVLASVNSVQPERGRFIVDAGWTALSRDHGTASQPVDQGYGLVCDVDGRPFPDLIVLEVTQEHGVIGPRPGSGAALPALAAGDMVRILPNHACATAGQHQAYLVTGEAGTVEARWPRWSGW